MKPKELARSKLQRWGNNNARTHERNQLKKAMKELGRRAIDKRTRTGKALAAWSRELIADMGGPANISVQQKTLVDLVVKQKLIVDTIDAWLLTGR